MAYGTRGYEDGSFEVSAFAGFFVAEERLFG